MIRDFSEAALEELLSLVKQVEDEQWCEFTDDIGDGWYTFEGWIGQLDIRKYKDNVNKYHKKVIDKNDASADDIKTIFTNVNTVSTNYQGRFLAIMTDLQAYGQLIKTIGAVISPENGSFDPAFIGNGLKDAVNTYLENSRLLMQIAGDGLDEDELAKIEAEDPAQLQQLLESMGSNLLAMTPNLKGSGKVEIPIGPDMTFYYEVEAKVDTGSNVDIEAVIEDQKLKVGKVSSETGGLLRIGSEITSDGDGKITVSSDSSSVGFDVNGKLEGTGSVTIGNNTYTIKVEGDLDEVVAEQSVTTKVEGGSVTSKIGIKKQNNNWKPIPVPVPVEVPYPSPVPDFDVDWETVGEVVVVVTIIYGVVYVGAAIYTGGGSVVVLPPPVPA